MSLLLKLATEEQERIFKGTYSKVSEQGTKGPKTISGELRSRFNKKFICNRAKRVARGTRRNDRKEDQTDSKEPDHLRPYK